MTDPTVVADQHHSSRPETIAAAKDRRKDRLLRAKAVVARTGLSVSTIYRREDEGTFPRRERLGGRCVAWYESDIDDFVSNPLGYRAP
jgi:prophage regulatory protein